MGDDPTPRRDNTSRNVTPTGRLGFRGRQATPEERALILDEFFFEGDRPQPYLVTTASLTDRTVALGWSADDEPVVWLADAPPAEDAQRDVARRWIRMHSSGQGSLPSRSGPHDT